MTKNTQISGGNVLSGVAIGMVTTGSLGMLHKELSKDDKDRNYAAILYGIVGLFLVSSFISYLVKNQLDKKEEEVVRPRRRRGVVGPQTPSESLITAVDMITAGVTRKMRQARDVSINVGNSAGMAVAGVLDDAKEGVRFTSRKLSVASGMVLTAVSAALQKERENVSELPKSPTKKIDSKRNPIDEVLDKMTEMKDYIGMLENSLMLGHEDGLRKDANHRETINRIVAGDKKLIDMLSTKVATPDPVKLTFRRDVISDPVDDKESVRLAKAEFAKLNGLQILYKGEIERLKEEYDEKIKELKKHYVIDSKKLKENEEKFKEEYEGLVASLEEKLVKSQEDLEEKGLEYEGLEGDLAEKNKTIEELEAINSDLNAKLDEIRSELVEATDKLSQLEVIAGAASRISSNSSSPNRDRSGASSEGGAAAMPIPISSPQDAFAYHHMPPEQYMQPTGASFVPVINSNGQIENAIPVINIHGQTELAVPVGQDYAGNTILKPTGIIVSPPPVPVSPPARPVVDPYGGVPGQLGVHYVPSAVAAATGYSSFGSGERGGKQ